MSNDVIIGRYVAMRDQIDVLEKEHKERLAPLKEAMKKIETFLLGELTKHGLENMKSVSGTAYKSKFQSVTAADKQAFLEFVKSNDAWELLDIRPLKSAVLEYKEENTELPPGLNYREEITVNVRR